MKIYLDPSIETHIRKHIGDKEIYEVNINEYGINVLYLIKEYTQLGELEIYWDEMK